MTDRFHSLIVVLEKDIREDDAQAMMEAIKCLKGVINVSGIVSNEGKIMVKLINPDDDGEYISDIWELLSPQTGHK